MRALQFVRSKAAEWRIDKTRIGGSAGGFSVLYLAFHPDAADPISREVHSPTVSESRSSAGQDQAGGNSLPLRQRVTPFLP